MPKLAKPLTELEVRKAKPQEWAYMLADGKGLYLSVSPTGLKSWILRFRLPGSRTATPATIGHYPTMSLAEARIRALETARDAKAGIATAGVRKAMRSAIEADIARKHHQVLAEAQAREAQLEAVATRWLAENRGRWQSETFRKARLVVESYFIPKLGAADLRTLQTKDVRPLLLEMSSKVPQLARKGEHSPHGFRATWRTLGRERLKIEVDVLECQLAHAPKSETEAAYARLKFLDERCRVLQEWANYLDRLREGAEVVPLKKSA